MTFLLGLLFCLISFILGAKYKSVYLFIRRKFKNKTKQDESLEDVHNNDKNYNFDDADLKMVFLVRDDLKMGTGKIAAQVAHAAVGLYDDITNKGTTYYQEALEHWNEFGAKKIVLKANGVEDLKEIHKLCKKHKIPSVMISDAGHTQVDPGTVTVVGVGPEATEKLNKITGKFKLFK